MQQIAKLRFWMDIIEKEYRSYGRRHFYWLAKTKVPIECTKRIRKSRFITIFWGAYFSESLFTGAFLFSNFNKWHLQILSNTCRPNVHYRNCIVRNEFVEANDYSATLYSLCVLLLYDGSCILILWYNIASHFKGDIYRGKITRIYRRGNR